jgi:hypothetical protein
MVVLSEKDQPDSSWVLQRTLFMYSKDEIANKPVTFEAYWRNPGELVGLCAVFGQQRRVFGLDGAGMAHIASATVRIPGNHCPTGFLISLATGDPNSSAATSPGVNDIRVSTKNPAYLGRTANGPLTRLQILCGRFWDHYPL